MATFFVFSVNMDRGSVEIVPIELQGNKPPGMFDSASDAWTAAREFCVGQSIEAGTAVAELGVQLKAAQMRAAKTSMVLANVESSRAAWERKNESMLLSTGTGGDEPIIDGRFGDEQ